MIFGIIISASETMPERWTMYKRELEMVANFVRNGHWLSLLTPINSVEYASQGAVSTLIRSHDDPDKVKDSVTSIFPTGNLVISR